MTCGDNVSPGVWYQEMPQLQNYSDYQYVNYVSCDPVGMDYAVPADGYTCSFETLLSEPLCAITDDMTYFDYDDPQDYEEWCDWDDPDVVEGYCDPFRPDVEGGIVFLPD